MNCELPITASHARPDWSALPLSRTTRALFAYCGVVLPVACHGLSLAGPPHVPLWQTGELQDKLAFILSPQAGLVLYPLLFYAIGAMALCLWNEAKYAQSFCVRLGVWSGVPLAAWYSFVFGLAYYTDGGLWQSVWFSILAGLGVVGVWLILAFFKWIVSRVKKHAALGAVAVISLLLMVGLTVAVTALRAQNPIESLAMAAMVPLYFSLFFAPLLVFFTFAVISMRLVFLKHRSRQFGIAQMLGVTAWLAVFLSSCRASVLLSLRAYSQLPVDPVGRCYLVTAAAQGHPRFVGTLPTREGQVTGRVNRQMQILKAFELTLYTLVPRWHRVLRSIYDVLGPPLAARVRNPWLADLGYLTLKPAEWAAACILRVLLRKKYEAVRHLYVGIQPPPASGNLSARAVSVFPSPWLGGEACRVCGNERRKTAVASRSEATDSE